MGLGKFILRSVVNSAMGGGRHRRSSGGIIEGAVKAAVVTGAATAATVAVNRMMNNRQQIQANGTHHQPAVPVSDPYSDAMIAKFAICYYVAKADGYVSPAEQMELDTIANELLSNSNISERARNEMTRIMNKNSISFSEVEAYLRKVESQTLISFAVDVDNIVKASEGVTLEEEKAVDIFKKYVERKTGCSFEVYEKPVKPTEVNLKCDCCNGTMELDSTLLKAVCPYCGSAKIIDSSQISSVVSEIERTKRANGGK